MDPEEIVKRAKCLNPEVINKYHLKKESVIVFTGHYRNWELLALAIYLQTEMRLDPVYKIQSNNFLNQFIYNKGYHETLIMNTPF